MKNWMTSNWLLPATLFCTFTVLVGCDGDANKVAAPNAPPPGVVVTPVIAKTVSASVEFIGQSQAVHKVDLRARVSGVLVERLFEEGSSVAKGAKLYQIDPAEFIAIRDAAAANVAREEARLEEADKNLARYQSLLLTEAASVAKFDEAKARAAQTRAELAAATADLERASLNVDYSSIASPIAGKIGRSAVHTGNLVGADSGILATVVALDPVHVQFSVGERQYLNYQLNIQSGTNRAFAAKLRLANDHIYAHTGEIGFVDSQVDPSTGTILARATFANPDGLIVPGQFVKISLVTAEPVDQLVVPQAAVQENQSGPFVLVVNGESRVEARAIKTGELAGTDIIVSEGLIAGETVIVEGIQKVRPGIEVTASLRATQPQ